MVSASDQVTIQGKPIDRLTKERYNSLNRLVRSSRFGGEKSDITVIQAIGYAGASAGTHAPKGGALDLTAFNHTKRNLGDRLLGGAGWYRPYLAGVWSSHYHTVTAGVGYAPLAAQRQVTAMYAGKNGLANNGADTGPRLLAWPLFVAPWTDRGKRGTYYTKRGVTARAQATNRSDSLGSIPSGAKFTVIAIVNAGGNLWAINTDGKHVLKADLTLSAPSSGLPTQSEGTPLRIGSLNFPDKTKITVATEEARIARAVQQIKAADLDILAIQEGVGSSPDGPDPGTERDASSLTRRLRDALGGDWDIVEPTTAYNENYFLRRTGTTDVDQHPDAIIRGTLSGAPLPGRHVSLATFDTSIGKITLGNTQLVNSNRPGAEVQAGLAAAALLAIGGKRVMLGDFNTANPSAGFTKGGLHDSRLIAAASTYRDAATYTNQTKLRPSTNPDWRIDGIWVSDGIVVNGYTVVLDLDSDGNFVLPRVSDHSLIIVSLS